MYGYVYITENAVNGRKYIGKHESKEYDSSYLGSGKVLAEAIRKYGTESFTNRVLYIASSREELNRAEKTYIEIYRRKYGRRLYNIASGGDGGNVFYNASEDEKQEFVKKMTEINRERCGSDDFKKKLSKATSKRYESEEERRKQSEKIRKAWSNDALRREQSERLKKYYSEHPADKSYLNIRCSLTINNNEIIFDSIKELRKYLKDNYNFNPSRKTLRELLDTEEPYKPFHKNKLSQLEGMVAKRIKSVETMGDECNPVGHEIGTCPKCKTEIEEIVRSV